MRKAEKKELVAQFEELLREDPHIILSGYRGLPVKEMVQLRRAIRGAGGQLRVVKKSLFQRALGEGEQAKLGEYMEGPIAVVSVSGDPLDVLKTMREFARTHEELAFRGGWVDAELLDAHQLVELASLPPYNELLAWLLASLSAPLTQFVGLLQAVPRDLALTLAAVAEKRGGEAEAPA